jgi:hypothetical protein
MSATFSDKQVNKWFSDISNVWLSLHYDDPSETSGSYSEVFGGSYNRQNASFGASSSRTIWNSNRVTWSGLPASEIAFIGAWEDDETGDLIWSCPAPLDPNGRIIKVETGKSFTLPISSIAITIS